MIRGGITTQDTERVTVEALHKSVQRGREGYGTLGSKVVGSPCLKPRSRHHRGAQVTKSLSPSNRRRDTLRGLPDSSSGIRRRGAPSVRGSPSPPGSPCSRQSPLRVATTSHHTSPLRSSASTSDEAVQYSPRIQRRREPMGSPKSPSTVAKAPHRLPALSSPLNHTCPSRHRRCGSDSMAGVPCSPDRVIKRRDLFERGSRRHSDPIHSLSNRQEVPRTALTHNGESLKHHRDSAYVHRSRLHSDVLLYSDDEDFETGGHETSTHLSSVDAIEDVKHHSTCRSKVVCFEQKTCIVYPRSTRVDPLPIPSAKRRVSNTHALGRSCLVQCTPSLNITTKDNSTVADGDSDVNITTMTCRRQCLAEDSGLTAKLAEGGFTLTHCDDPDQQDPGEAAAEARQRALELRHELKSDYLA